MITLEEKLEGVTVIETAPLLFTGIVDENIEQNFTLYLLQESEGKFTIFAPTFYNADLPMPDSDHYPITLDFKMSFDSLEEAKEQFDSIVFHLGEPLDLHDLSGGFMLLDFDMDTDIYKKKPSLLPQYENKFVRYGHDEAILLRIVNVENNVIINKRMCLQYDTKEAALETYLTIVKFFKAKEQLNLEHRNPELDIHETLTKIVATNFSNIKEIEFGKDDSDRYKSFHVVLRKGNLHAKIGYSVHLNMFIGRRVEWSVKLVDVSTKTELIDENSILSDLEFTTVLQRVLPFIS